MWVEVECKRMLCPASAPSITELAIDSLASLYQILSLCAKEGLGKVRQFNQCYSATGRLPTSVGVLNIVFATGSAAGASLGGYIADSLGWRWFVPPEHCHDFALITSQVFPSAGPCRPFCDYFRVMEP